MRTREKVARLKKWLDELILDAGNDAGADWQEGGTGDLTHMDDLCYLLALLDGEPHDVGIVTDEEAKTFDETRRYLQLVVDPYATNKALEEFLRNRQSQPSREREALELLREIQCLSRDMDAIRFSSGPSADIGTDARLDSWREAVDAILLESEVGDGTHS
jgi:hypothetical protein